MKSRVYVGDGWTDCLSSPRAKGLRFIVNVSKLPFLCIANEVKQLVVPAILKAANLEV